MTEPFATDTYHVAGHVIVIESYRDGGPSYQRNGSGSYNARSHTRWDVTADGVRRGSYHSRHGYAKWEAYEFTRQTVARTDGARPLRDRGQIRGWTRPAVVARAEMKEVAV